MDRDLSHLPGGDLVAKGLDDLRSGDVTAEALLVSIASTNLAGLGFDVHEPIRDADHKLWELLAADDPDAAHGRYNALVRRLVSFERACAA